MNGLYTIQRGAPRGGADFSRKELLILACLRYIVLPHGRRGFAWIAKWTLSIEYE